MRERAAKQGVGIRAVRAASMVLKPSRMTGILIEVAVADVMVLTADHAAKALEVALNQRKG
jgi:hypothetical protein